MLKKILLLSVLLGLLGFVWTVIPVRAQDNVVKLENERVRVYERVLKPGDKEPMHTHPEYVLYFLTDAKMRIYGPDGKVLGEGEFKAGNAYWSKPVKHMTENIGTAEIHIIMVEFKTNPYKE